MTAGYSLCVLIHLNSQSAIFLTGVYTISVQNSRQTVWRLCIYHAVSAAVHRNHTTSLRPPNGGRAEIVRWLCDPPVFFKICVPNLYNSFLIEIAFQMCKTKYSIRQRHQLTQTLTHRKVAARLSCGRREIAAQYPCHFMGTARAPCDNLAIAVRGPYN